MEKATFAAGCFWGVEKELSRVNGVIATKVGYTGGHVENPSYEEVCRGNTGHAEAIEVEFDPTVISYSDLLNQFWNMHNPTTMNRQGPDVGAQYRSAIFYHSPEQQQQALASKAAFAKLGKYSDPIVTEITAATTFYPAEEYHQKYLDKNGVDYC